MAWIENLPSHGPAEGMGCRKKGEVGMFSFEGKPVLRGDSLYFDAGGGGGEGWEGEEG